MNGQQLCVRQDGDHLVVEGVTTIEAGLASREKMTFAGFLRECCGVSRRVERSNGTVRVPISALVNGQFAQEGESPQTVGDRFCLELGEMSGHTPVFVGL